MNVLTIQNRFEKPQNIEENKVVSEQADWLYKIDKIKIFGIMVSDLSGTLWMTIAALFQFQGPPPPGDGNPLGMSVGECVREE